MNHVIITALNPMDKVQTLTVQEYGWQCHAPCGEKQTQYAHKRTGVKIWLKEALVKHAAATVA